MKREILCGMALLTVALTAGCGGGSVQADHGSTQHRQPAGQWLYPEVRVRGLEMTDDTHAIAVAETWASVSEDGGKSWRRIDLGAKIDTPHMAGVAVSKGGTYLLTNAGAFRTQDGGEDWKKEPSVDPAASDDLFGSHDSPWVGLRDGSLRAIDTGKTLAGAGVITGLVELPSKTLVAASFGKGSFRSTDQGTHWTASVSGLPTPDVTAIEVLPKGVLLAGTFGGGVAHSSDEGLSWTVSNQGLEDLEVQSLVSLGDGKALAGAQRGLFRSGDGQTHWKRVDGEVGRDNVQALATNGKGVVLAGTWGNGVYRSEDGGGSWDHVDIRGVAPHITEISTRPDGPMYVGTSNGEVFKLIPEDGTWTSLGKMDDSAVSRLVMSAKGVLVGATKARLFRFDGNARAWVRFPFIRPGRKIKDVVLNGSGRVFAEDRGDVFEDNNVFFTDDWGRTWDRVEPEGSLHASTGLLRADPTGQTLLAGCTHASLDGGKHWKELHIPSAEFCTVAAGRKHRVLVVSHWEDSRAYSLDASGSVRKRGSFTGMPRCAVVRPNGELVVAVASGEKLLVMPEGATEARVRNKKAPACAQMVGRDDGSLVMRAKGGVFRSTDGGVTWARIDGLQTADGSKDDAEKGKDK